MLRHLTAATALAVLVFFSTLTAQGVNADAAAIADFTKRVNDYTALQKKLDATLQEAPADGRPEQFIDHQRALAKLIQRDRLTAVPGDIVAKQMRDLVRRILAGIFKGPGGAEIKSAIMDEYTGGVRLTVNGPYPDSVPLSSVPPQVLAALPKLPEILEYRFVGKRMILFDTHARLIADVVERAIP